MGGAQRLKKSSSRATIGCAALRALTVTWSAVEQQPADDPTIGSDQIIWDVFESCRRRNSDSRCRHDASGGTLERQRRGASTACRRPAPALPRDPDSRRTRGRCRSGIRWTSRVVLDDRRSEPYTHIYNSSATRLSARCSLGEWS